MESFRVQSKLKFPPHHTKSHYLLLSGFCRSQTHIEKPVKKNAAKKKQTSSSSHNSPDFKYHHSHQCGVTLHSVSVNQSQSNQPINFYLKVNIFTGSNQMNYITNERMCAQTSSQLNTQQDRPHHQGQLSTSPGQAQCI